MTTPQSCQDQLDKWVKGESVHNLERGECCPDFSCCQPNLAWPMELRVEFFEADDPKRENMMMMSLGAMLEGIGRRDEVFIAGLDGDVDV